MADTKSLDEAVADAVGGALGEPVHVARGADGIAWVQPGAAKVKVWRIRPKEGGGWLIGRDLVEIAETLAAETSAGRDEDNPRSSFLLECVEMTEEALSKVGEFDGW